jgi:hypothetical protein
MPRAARRWQWTESACYHLRGHARETVFHDDEDRAFFVTLLARDRFGLRLYHYCLMDNHFHLLLELVGVGQLSRVVASLLVSYWHHYPRRYRLVGHLFQGRFKSPAVEAGPAPPRPEPGRLRNCRCAMATTAGLLTILAITAPAGDAAQAEKPGQAAKAPPAANTFQVTRNGDAGAPAVVGSLSWAIAGVNGSAPATANTISFHLAAGPTIRVTKPLAAITKPVTVDGWSQNKDRPGVAVVISGDGLAGNGLTFDTGGCCLRGVAVTRFGGYGIVLNNGAGAGSLVEGCTIGTDLTGTAAGLGNGGGILVRGPANIIGKPRSGCLIAGNAGDGITITGPAAQRVVVQGCLIGVDRTGLAALPNTEQGIAVVKGAGNCTLGGKQARSGNIISGNGGYGVYLHTSDGNQLLSNLIGPGEDGTTLIGNGRGGVGLFARATENVIGAAHCGNVISGNAGHGVLLSGRDVQRNRLPANLIGSDSIGGAAMPNRGDGIHLEAAWRNTIGGYTEAERSYIAGNLGDEIRIASGSYNAVIAVSVGVGKGDNGFALGRNGVSGIGGSHNGIGTDD